MVVVVGYGPHSPHSIHLTLAFLVMVMVVIFVGFDDGKLFMVLVVK